MEFASSFLPREGLQEMRSMAYLLFYMLFVQQAPIFQHFRRLVSYVRPIHMRFIQQQLKTRLARLA